MLSARLDAGTIRMKLTGFQIRTQILDYFHAQSVEHQDAVYATRLDSNEAYQVLHFPDLPQIICLHRCGDELNTLRLEDLPVPLDLNQRMHWFNAHSIIVEWPVHLISRVEATWARLMDVLEHPTLLHEPVPYAPSFDMLIQASTFLRNALPALDPSLIPSTPS